MIPLFRDGKITGWVNVDNIIFIKRIESSGLTRITTVNDKQYHSDTEVSEVVSLIRLEQAR